MTRAHVIVAVLCLLGLFFPPIWLIAAVVYEFAVRRGSRVAGLWLSSRFWD